MRGWGVLAILTYSSTFRSLRSISPRLRAARYDFCRYVQACDEYWKQMKERARKVLLVDDEADLLELLELTLIKMGLDVARAQTVGEAMRKLSSERFDLCLTDMRLPDGDGLRVVQHIAEKSLDVPVAVITAHGSTENAVAALKGGAFDYLGKPVARSEEHTSNSSHLVISYAVFCLKK